MSNFEVGNIVEGKILKLKPFGAIIELENSSQGLVHISQIANGFVQNINDHLKEGDKVKVKVMSIDKESGKISLSIREALPPQQNFNQRRNNGNKRISSDNNNRTNNHNHQDNRLQSTVDPMTTFEDKLKEWNKQSTERQAGINKRNNKRY